MVKKLFLVLFFIFVIAAIGLFVFILTLDVNRFKPVLGEKIEEAIQKNIKLGNISVGIFPPVTINVNAISVKDFEKTWDDALLEAGSLNARVKILPLLRKDIEIERLLVRDMDILLRDDVKIGITEAVLKNISLYGPININAKLSLFGRGAENIIVTGLLYPEVETKTPFIKNLELDIDMSRIDLISGLEALGQKKLSREFTGKDLEGNLTITSEKLYLDLGKIYDSNLYLDLSKGKMEIPFIKEGFKDIKLKARMKKRDMIIEKLTGVIAGGSLSADGEVENVLFRQAWDLDLSLKKIDISRILPDTDPGRPTFKGRFDIGIDVSGSGFSQDKLLSSLRGKGDIDIYDAVLMNMNLLESALSKLDMLPGIVSKLKRHVPNYYKDVLKQNYTSFKPIKARFELRNGSLFFKDVLIESDGFYLKGDASLGFDRVLRVQADLFIPKDLSGAFIDVADEFAYLQNNQGMITMPLVIRGKLPDISVMPDMEYVIKRLAVSKGQELLESIFRREEPKETGDEVIKEGEEGTQQGEKSQKQRKPEPEEVLIKTIFDIISGPKE